MAGTACLSAFISNTGTVATLLPAVVAAAWTVGSVPSKYLMPLAFAANTGGLLTLTGTPPTIVVAQTLEQSGLRPFSFFEFALIGRPLLIAADSSLITPGMSRLRQTRISRNFHGAYGNFRSTRMDSRGTRMEYQQFAQDPALRRTLHFTAVEQVEAAIRRAGLTSHRLHQLGSGPWQSEWEMLEKDGIKLFSSRYEKAFALPFNPPEGMVALIFGVSAGDPLLASGQDVANNALLFLPRERAADIVAPRLSGAESICLTEERFFEIATATAPEMKPIEEVAGLRSDTSRLCELRRAIMGIIAHPEQDPLGERLHNLIAATINWMANANAVRVDTTKAQAAIAKRTQEYLEAHYHEGVRVEELCHVAGVGARTLQRCFRVYFDLTISQYLKSVRLSATHRALVGGRGNGISVAEVALQHGFGHLGRFSVDFKNRFGESPSETLGLRPKPAPLRSKHSRSGWRSSSA